MRATSIPGVAVLPLAGIAFGLALTAGDPEWGVFARTGKTGTGLPQSAAPATGPFTFDVASIRPSPPSPDGHNHIWNDVHNSHLRTGNLAIRDLLQYAWNLPKSQIIGGPAWLDSAHYDIDASSSQEVDALLKAMSNDDATTKKRTMVRELLRQRFSLAAHEEKRELPVFNLVPARAGARLTPSDRGGTSIDTGRSRIHVQGGDDTIGLLARELAQREGRPVVNKTGLTGRYDLALRWTPDDAPAPLLNGGPDPAAPPGLFTAIEEQLGLRLEPGRGTVSVLVIDQIAYPSAN